MGEESALIAERCQKWMEEIVIPARLPPPPTFPRVVGIEDNSPPVTAPCQQKNKKCKELHTPGKC